MFALLAYIIGLLGVVLLLCGTAVYVLTALAGSPPRRLRVPLAILSGYAAGALFVWSLVPRRWPLSFWTTFAATVDAQKYGHPVEHYAEGIVIGMLFGAALGGVLAGFIAYIVAPRRPA